MKSDLRVKITKQILKESLIKCIANKPLSRITVSELCKTAGINRGTFYNHYDSPTMILKDIAEDYALELRALYYSVKKQSNNNGKEATKACLNYLYERKDNIKILLSDNAENAVTGFGLEIVTERLAETMNTAKDSGSKSSGSSKSSKSNEDIFLYMIITSSAAYGLINAWLTKDIDKTPDEILDFIEKAFGEELFQPSGD